MTLLIGMMDSQIDKHAGFVEEDYHGTGKIVVQVFQTGKANITLTTHYQPAVIMLPILGIAGHSQHWVKMAPMLRSHAANVEVALR